MKKYKVYIVTDSSGRIKQLGDALLNRVFVDGSVINVVEYPNHSECKSFVILANVMNCSTRLKVNGEVYLRRIPASIEKKVSNKALLELASKYIKHYPDCDVVSIPKEERLLLEEEETDYLNAIGRLTKKQSTVGSMDNVSPPPAKKIEYKKPEVIEPPVSKPSEEEPKLEKAETPAPVIAPTSGIKIKGLNAHFVEALRYMTMYQNDLKEKDDDIIKFIADMIFAEKCKMIVFRDYLERAEEEATCKLEAIKIIRSVNK